jgi:hypothetical protein
VVYSAPMTTERIKRMLALLATLAAAAVFAVGCGDDDKDSNTDSGGGSSLSETTEQTDSIDAPGNKDEVIERCFEEAKKLDGEAKEQAEATCKAAEAGEVPEVDTDEVKEQAKQQCLDATKQIPDEAARKQAEDACEKFGE